jgi:hypothetical protein
MSHCLWITKNKKNCSHPRVSEETLYCRIHSIYENKYVPEDIQFLEKCITCSFLTKPTNLTRQCDKCFENTPIRNCKWKNRDGNNCSRRSLIGKLCCLVHQEFEDVSLEDCSHCNSCRNYFKKQEYQKCPKCYPITRLCSALTYDKKRCENLRKDGYQYCGTHSHYENYIKPEEFDKLPICKGCRLFYHPDDTGYRLCSKCHSRQKKIISKCDTSLPICKAIIHTTGNPCENYAKSESEYCGIHTSYEKLMIKQENGIIVCSNWIRGCWNETTSEYSKCEECREKDRENYKIKREETKELYKLAETSNSSIRICVRCKQEKSLSNFIHSVDKSWSSSTEIIHNSRITVECDECRKKASLRDKRLRIHRKIIFKKRSSRKYMSVETIIRHKYYDYKFKDFKFKYITNKNDFENNLPRDFAFKLMKKPCSYCNIPTNEENVNGLDRLDNKKGHSKWNVISCCETCNKMKQTMTFYQFKNHIQKIHKTLLNKYHFHTN